MKRTEAYVMEKCPQRWDKMEGSDTRRHCDVCDKEVHDLSSMTEEEARSTVAQGQVCVQYTMNQLTEEIIHRPEPGSWAKNVALVTLVITPFLALGLYREHRIDVLSTPLDLSTHEVRWNRRPTMVEHVDHALGLRDLIQERERREQEAVVRGVIF